MKSILSKGMIYGVLLFALLSAVAAYAEEVKIIGTVSRITMAADKKSAVVILKDVKSGEDVSITVEDELTLDKFNDKRIVDGDEIRCKYDNEGGKNISKLFRKTAGC